jgi:hypothetical protein
MEKLLAQPIMLEGEEEPPRRPMRRRSTVDRRGPAVACADGAAEAKSTLVPPLLKRLSSAAVGRRTSRWQMPREQLVHGMRRNSLTYEANGGSMSQLLRLGKEDAGMIAAPKEEAERPENLLWVRTR